MMLPGGHMAQVRRSFIVAASQRSGSTLLCRGLQDTGVAGRPEEYFLTGPPEVFPPGWRFWEEGIFATPNGAMTRAAYIELVHQLGTTGNGVFSAKLMWNYVPLVLERVEEMAEHRGRSERDKLEVLFPRLDGLVMLTRRDKIRQAVSWLRASQDGVWVVSDNEPAAPSGTPRYDGEIIAGMITLLEEADRGWTEFAATLDVEPIHVVYEDLVDPDSYQDAIRDVLNRLGLEEDAVEIGPARTSRQSDDLNDAWVDRFVRERNDIAGTRRHEPVASRDRPYGSEPRAD